MSEAGDCPVHAKTEEGGHVNQDILSIANALGTNVGQLQEMGYSQGLEVPSSSMQETQSVMTTTQVSPNDDVLKKKKPGRSPSQIWVLLTDEPNPQRKNAAACKHCKQQVLYYKKSEQAIRHLKKCSVFQNSQHQYSFISQFQDILPLYNQKISSKTSRKRKQMTNSQGGCEQVQTNQTEVQVRVQKNQTLHCQNNSHDLTRISTQNHFVDSTTPGEQAGNLYSTHHGLSQSQISAAVMSNSMALNQQGLSDAFMDSNTAMSVKDDRHVGPAKVLSNSNGQMAIGTHGIKDPVNHATTVLGNNKKQKFVNARMSKVQQDRFEEALAMHVFATGLPFSAISESHLQRAFFILRQNINLPDKSKLAGQLLHRCFDKMYKRVWNQLSSSMAKICIKRDDWSGVNVLGTSRHSLRSHIISNTSEVINQRRYNPLAQRDINYSTDTDPDMLADDGAYIHGLYSTECDAEEINLVSTYMAVSGDKRFFIESVKFQLDHENDVMGETDAATSEASYTSNENTKDLSLCSRLKDSAAGERRESFKSSAHFNSILIAQDIKRIMAPIIDNVNGVVTAATEHHARAWELLKAEYPTKFFYGCISHALRLAVMDIFQPEVSSHKDSQQVATQLPSNHPFLDLCEFTAGCNELITFFLEFHLSIQSKMLDTGTLTALKTVAIPPQKNTAYWDNASAKALKLLSSLSWPWMSPVLAEVVSLAARFRVLLQVGKTLQNIVQEPNFLSLVSIQQQEIRKRMKAFCLQDKWHEKLSKALGILNPIDLVRIKFQGDNVSISEVYYEAKNLLAEFDSLPGITREEAAYVKAVLASRLQCVLSEAHGLAYLLDPRYIGKSMTREYREQIEEIIFSFPEFDGDVLQREERKRVLSSEYTEYIIYAKTQRTNRTFKWEMLEKGNRTPLQFWMTEADDWPQLKAIALAIFSLVPNSTAPEREIYSTNVTAAIQNNAQILAEVDKRKLAFIVINSAQFTSNNAHVAPPATSPLSNSDSVVSNNGFDSRSASHHPNLNGTDYSSMQVQTESRATDFSSSSNARVGALSTQNSFVTEAESTLLPESMMMWMI